MFGIDPVVCATVATQAAPGVYKVLSNESPIVAPCSVDVKISHHPKLREECSPKGTIMYTVVR